MHKDLTYSLPFYILPLKLKNNKQYKRDLFSTPTSSSFTLSCPSSQLDRWMRILQKSDLSKDN